MYARDARFSEPFDHPSVARDARFFRHMGHLDRKRENGFAMDSGAENEKGPQPHHVTLLS